MRISHIELEQCLRTPQQWLATKAAPIKGRAFGYNSLLKLAIHRFHKTNSINQARQYLTDKIKEHEFRNLSKVDEIRINLDLYLQWCSGDKPVIADSRVRITLDVGSYLALSGIVSRVDITTKGYRGILLGIPQGNWKTQLRMPLIQKALSNLYTRPLETIAVGVQKLDGSSIQTFVFSSSDVGKAEKEFRKLGETVRSLR